MKKADADDGRGRVIVQRTRSKQKRAPRIVAEHWH